MRFLIQHSRWTLEFFTSTQQQPVGCSAEQSNSTLASRDHILKSVATSPGHSPIIPSAIPKSSAKVEDISIESDLAPTRNRNIRKRLGRFFLHFAQRDSHSKDETHAYQYNGNASELPAGDIPIEGSTTVEEMPTSFDDCTAFELQSQPYSSSGHFYSMNSSQDEIPYSSQQDFCKPTYTREISIARGSSHAAIPQRLPRLAVPGSLHDLPAMTTEQSPHSASTISPNTPVNPFHNSAQPYWLPQSPHTVSPCDAPTSQWYDRPSFQAQHIQHMRRSFGSPMTISPAGSSNSTTPMSAHSTSVHTSFGHWPQPGPEYLQAAFPQRYQPLGYESCTQPVSHQPIAWTTDVNIQPHQYHNSASRVQEQMTASEQFQDLSQFRNQPKPTAYDMSKKSLYAEAQLLPAIQIDDTTTYDCEAIEPPPAYSPVSTSKTKYPAAICYYCSKSFTGKYGKGNCKRHVQQVHETVLDKLMHMCKVCFKTYNRADALRKHQWKKHRDADARPNKRRRS